MSSWTLEDRHGARWVSWTPTRMVTVSLVVGAMLVAVVALTHAAESGPMWPAAVVMALTVVTAISPDSSGGLVTLACYGLWWQAGVSDLLTPWALVAALAVLVFHVTVAHASSGPAGASPDLPTVLSWGVDSALVALATVALAGLVAVAHDGVHSSQAMVGVALLLVAVLAWKT